MINVAMPYIFLILLLPVCFSSYAEDTVAETAVVSRITIPQVYRSHGAIEAVHKATMTAETSGRIAQVYFDVDDIVTRGDVIARFRNEKQKAELDLSLAGLEEAKAEYERSQSDFTRFEDLFNRKLVAVSALDKARSDLKAAEARRNAAEARIKRAREDFENTIIRAPYSGIVTRRHIEVGEAVSPGSPLVSGLSLDAIRAVVDIPQAYVDAVRNNKKAIIYLANDTLESEAITVFPYADEKSHTFRVRVELPKGTNGLYPGMLVKLGFVIGEKQVLVVPTQTIVNRGEMTAVYIQQTNGRIAMRQVRVGESIDETQTIIHAGISESELVYMDPLAATVALKQQSAKAQ